MHDILSDTNSAHKYSYLDTTATTLHLAITLPTVYNIPYEVCSGLHLLGLWLRLECSLDSLSKDSAHVIYVSEGYDVAYNRRTASQPSYVVLRVTWYVKTFRNVNYVC